VRALPPLSAAAGCYSAFVGFETFNPQNLLATTKVQNLAKEHRQKKDAAVDVALAGVKEKYRRVCRNWHRHGVSVHCGYMIGFPFDGPECGRQSAEWLLDVGVDLASFFIVTRCPAPRTTTRRCARARSPTGTSTSTTRSTWSRSTRA
jgi:hypothetical protein